MVGTTSIVFLFTEKCNGICIELLHYVSILGRLDLLLQEHK